jgi:hypothetical protein
MEETPTARPWILWLLLPFVLPVALVFGLVFVMIALVVTPYFLVYPDRHLQKIDIDGTDAQRARLARWRAGYRALGFFGRIRRAVKSYPRVRARLTRRRDAEKSS